MFKYKVQKGAESRGFFPEEDEASIANIYIAIQVDIIFAAEYIRANYPHACRVILLPKSFSSIVAALSRKSIQCLPCHNIASCTEMRQALHLTDEEVS